LYTLVKARYPDSFVTGRDLFSSGLFTDPKTTSLFYTFIAELSLSCLSAQPTRTHHFLHKLEKTGKLLRSYTQNIDGLERRLGLESGGRGKGLKKKSTKNVELHGDLGRVRCVLCMTDYEARRDWVDMFREGEGPDCPACIERSADRVARSARALPVGKLRPAIVLYDEPHPLGDQIGDLQLYDMSRKPDVLLIMGTSLKVHGLRRSVKEFAKAVHANKGLVVFVNATAPSKEWEGIIDVHVHGETDRWVDKVEEEWRRVRPGDWETQTLLDGGIVAVGPGKNGKPKGKAVKCECFFVVVLRPLALHWYWC
jgi:NAD-dependent histone deacetylase SIR2